MSETMKPHNMWFKKHIFNNNLALTLYTILYIFTYTYIFVFNITYYFVSHYALKNMHVKFQSLPLACVKCLTKGVRGKFQMHY